jgi:hypothetical protein
VASELTFKTVNLSEFQATLQIWMSEQTAIMRYYYESSWRTFELTRYTRGQQQISRAADLVLQSAVSAAGNDQKAAAAPFTVVAFGDGSFSSSMRGHRSAPIRKLRQRLVTIAKKSANMRVVHMPEHRTSKLCSACHRDVRGWHPLGDPSKHEFNNKQWDEEHVRAIKQIEHKSRLCPHCKVCWDRDVNSARNMVQHTLRLLCRKPIPKAFWPDKLAVR